MKQFSLFWVTEGGQSEQVSGAIITASLYYFVLIMFLSIAEESIYYSKNFARESEQLILSIIWGTFINSWVGETSRYLLISKSGGHWVTVINFNMWEGTLTLDCGGYKNSTKTQIKFFMKHCQNEEEIRAGNEEILISKQASCFTLSISPHYLSLHLSWFCYFCDSKHYILA